MKISKKIFNYIVDKLLELYNMNNIVDKIKDSKTEEKRDNVEKIVLNDKIKKQKALATEIIREFDMPDLFSRTAEMAFYLSISIFPSMIFIICALAYIPIVNLLMIQDTLSQVIPTEAFNIVLYLINSAVENRSIHLLVFSFLLATWTFSKAVKSMIKGQNTSFRFKENRGFIKLNLICMLYAVGFFISILLSVVFLVYGDNLGNLLVHFLGDFFILKIIYEIFRYIVPITVMTIVFVSLFTLGPCEKLNFRKSILGAVVTTVLWLVLSLIYSYYATHFFKTKEIYGSISSIIILLTWLYFCAMSITIGYKINAVKYRYTTYLYK